MIPCSCYSRCCKLLLLFFCLCCCFCWCSKPCCHQLCCIKHELRQNRNMHFAILPSKGLICGWGKVVNSLFSLVVGASRDANVDKAHLQLTIRHSILVFVPLTLEDSELQAPTLLSLRFFCCELQSEPTPFHSGMYWLMPS